MMDKEIRQAVSEVREMKQMCGNINMKLTNIVTQRGQDYKKKLEAEYQRGLDDGRNETWEAARKIVCDEGFERSTLLHIFKTAALDTIFGDFSSSEVIAKLKAYEEKQSDKIEVGDEVTAFGKLKCIVTVADYGNDVFYVLFSDGSCGKKSVDTLEKTGRHFDIASILENMRND